MHHAALLPPLVHGPGAVVPDAPFASVWRLRLRDFTHVRLALEAPSVVRPGRLAGSSTLVIVHGGDVALHLIDGGALHLHAGEAVLLGRAAGWELALPERAGEPRIIDLALAPPLCPRPPLPRGAGDGAAAEVSVVALGFEDEGTSEQLEWLPPLVSTASSGERSAVSTAVLAGLDGGPGFCDDPTLFARALEILVIDLLRRRVPREGRALPGSPMIRKAVSLMRSELAAPWRVATLGARVGLSRSAFAARFTLEMGEPPLHYLAKLRLRAAAASLLRRSDEPIKSVAAAVGYESMPSFCKAFRLYFGVSPGAYRSHRKAL